MIVVEQVVGANKLAPFLLLTFPFILLMWYMVSGIIIESNKEESDSGKR